MSKNKDLFKEAIADAKAVREAALANAKAALEEALAPKLQSMLSAKLQEMEEGLDEAEDKDEMEEGFHPENTGDVSQDRERAKGFALEENEDEALEEDFDLSEILAELNDSDEDDMNEAKKDDKKKKDDKDEESEDEDEESEKITDLTVDELKDMIKDIVSSELEAEEYETPEEEAGEEGGEEMSMDLGGNEEGEEEIKFGGEELEEIDLDELLAELDALDNDDQMEEGLGDTVKKIGSAVKAGFKKHVYNPETDSPSAVRKGLAAGKKYAKLPSNIQEKEEKEEMKEAVATINTLRKELNEVNLLNAKLLYVNRIFKAKNLTESQKLKVIAQFDKANTTKEAKDIYESMNSAILKSTKKNTIKESLGFASKAAGVAPQKQIVQVDETVSRWQILAGIKTK